MKPRTAVRPAWSDRSIRRRAMAPHGGSFSAWKITISPMPGMTAAARVPMLADPLDRRSWYAQSRSRAAAALLLAAPGIPALFMGEEIPRGQAVERRRDRPSGHLIWWDGLTQRPGDGELSPLHAGFGGAAAAGSRRSRADGVRVSRANDYDRIIVRASLGRRRQSRPGCGGRRQFRREPEIRLPDRPAATRALAGTVQQRFLRAGFPIRAAVGNGGSVFADGSALDGFAHSAVINIPANGALFLGGW